ncbi:MAG: hypothetical protein C4519_20080 [Desulfobacteraceae bacterium]|nr:MAG: hypothetical protein C4519_20080 [Desulfobacteraceae bacterium]
MNETKGFHAVEVVLSTNLETKLEKPQPGTPFKILVMGDFSGRAEKEPGLQRVDLAERKLYSIDRDSDEAVLAKLGACLRLPAAGEHRPAIELQFGEMDDFQPDQIYSQADIFKALREVRKKISDPNTFSQTAARLLGQSSAAERREDNPVHPREAEGGRNHATNTAGLLDDVLNAGSEAVHAPVSSRRSDWDRFLGNLVRPHLVPDIEQEQEELLSGIDRTISATMADILHHPRFQSLEAAWRAMRFLLRRLETDENLQVYLLDISKPELAAVLAEDKHPQSTALYRKLAEFSDQRIGEAPWALLAGNYMFEKSPDDLRLLTRLGDLGRLLGAPFIGAGGLSLIGCGCLDDLCAPANWRAASEPEVENAWRTLRTSPQARWLGLALGRFLLRLPYGEKTDEVAYFAFEETGAAPAHEHYLWGNPVFACALLLGMAHTRDGWDMRPGTVQDIDHLPTHVFVHDGESIVKPCAEVVLTVEAVEQILNSGLMPLLSFKGQDRVRLARFQSIADPVTRMAGRWPA